jgi:hypothetical protein
VLTARMTAAIRPDSWNFPLFLHVFGAMILFGGLLGGAIALLAARRAAYLPSLGFRILLVVALPGYVLMRIGAEWIYSKEGFSGDNDPAWIGIGYTTADGGALVLVAALVLGGIHARRSRTTPSPGLARAGGFLAALLIAVYVVTVWAMGTKPD